MDYIYIGNLVNTHGIKGEVRIISNFKYKKLVFTKDFKIYIGRNKKEMIINSYRFHKIYDMITFKGINDINEVLEYKGSKVYINKNDLKIDGYFNEEIIGLKAYMGSKYIGVVSDILETKAHEILEIKKDKTKNLIPYIDEFILKVDLENKEIHIKEMEGLINEN